MIKCNGREALSILAEVEADKRELTKSEMAYANGQAMSFKLWLVNTAKKTMDEATEICERIIASEVKLLLADDPFAEFTWSRPNDEVGDLEIDLATSLGADFEKCSNEQHFLEQEYWNQMERTAEKNEGKYSDDQWKASNAKREQALEMLAPHQHDLSVTLKLDADALKRVRSINKRINELRFGKQPVLLHRDWAIVKNVLNELLGLEKRYTVKEMEPKSVEENIDALDNAVYGFDIGRYLDSKQA